MEEKNNENNDVELDEQELSLGGYPLDDIMIRTQQITVRELSEDINDGLFILDPDFQRDFVWSSKQQSRLIESAIMRIPIPVFYFAETSNGQTIVVDGLQRVTTFHMFLNDKFPLKHLAKDSKLKGKKFSQLDPKLRNRIKRTNLTLYVIDEKAPERAKLDIFDRVNSGTTLTRQQMRNCLHMGEGTRWLKNMSEEKIFIQATGHSLNIKTMRDRELINRFCAFYLLGSDNYKGYMDDFLVDALRHMNEMSADQLNEMSNSFLQSMESNYKVFGKHAFRKHFSSTKDRSVLNASLFDIYSVALARISKKNAFKHKETIHKRFIKSMKDKMFIESITRSTNTVRSVSSRFAFIDDLLGDLYD